MTELLAKLQQISQQLSDKGIKILIVASEDKQDHEFFQIVNQLIVDYSTARSSVLKVSNDDRLTSNQ